MVKIWAKIIKGEKILKDCIYTCEGDYHSSHFHDYLFEICHELDVATPIPLYSHKFNFTNFNCTRFFPSDFAEEVDFDKLVLENCPQK